MIKTIDIDDKPVKFDTSLAWMILYKAQFGDDPLSIIMPALQEAIPLVFVATSKDNKIDLNDLTESDIEGIADIFGTLEATQVLNIIWALAKNADNKIEEPMDWLHEFEYFPIDEIITQLVPALAETCISKKKYKALAQKIKKTRTAKNSMQALRVSLPEESAGD
jgi:hypothetical protein